MTPNVITVIAAEDIGKGDAVVIGENGKARRSGAGAFKNPPPPAFWLEWEHGEIVMHKRDNKEIEP